MPRLFSTKGEHGKERSPLPGDAFPQQRPRFRSPKGVQDRLPFHHVLPTYSGPYGVGYLELEVPARNPQTYSHITRKGRHLLQLETVLFSLYYPAARGSGIGRNPGGQRHWAREKWLPHPRIPCFRNAKLADHWAPKRDAELAGQRTKNGSDSQSDGSVGKPTFPLMMFSHGLGGTRTTYSSLCGEFASYGFVVCAVEHRDGSGPRTFVNHSSAGVGSRREREATGDVDHLMEEEKFPWDVQDAIIPKHNPTDTKPSNEDGVDSELRAAQIDLRIAEVQEAYEVLKDIANGHGSVIAEKNVRNADGIGASPLDLEDIDWGSWKGRVNTAQVSMVGHSFGAATTIEILRHSDRFHWVSQGIMYDIWGMALKPSDFDSKSSPHINVPLLGVNSEAFMYWNENFNAAKRVCEEAKLHGSFTWLLTVRGTVHLSQSDFCILYPRLAALVFKQTINPRRAIDINISASLEFLAKVIPEPVFPFQGCFEEDQFLEVAPVEEIPTDNKPDEQWMAVRLKVPRELWIRAVPKWRRKLQAYGGPIEAEKDIWMHVVPTEEEPRMERPERNSTGPLEDATAGPLQEVGLQEVGGLALQLPNDSVINRVNVETASQG